MPVVHYTAKVKGRHLIELPEEAMELHPGELVLISIELEDADKNASFSANEKGLAIMREIAELQKDMPYSSGENTLKLLHEARDGAMYG